MKLKDQVVLQAAILKRLRAEHDACRHALLEEMTPGERLVAATSEGEKLGTVSLTDPKPTAFVADMETVKSLAPAEALVDVFAPGMFVKAMEVVKEHAPELLEHTVANWYVEKLKADTVAAARTGGDVPPGMGVRRGDPAVMVRPAEFANREAEAICFNNHLTRELEA